MPTCEHAPVLDVVSSTSAETMQVAAVAASLNCSKRDNRLADGANLRDAKSRLSSPDLTAWARRLTGVHRARCSLGTGRSRFPSRLQTSFVHHRTIPSRPSRKGGSGADTTSLERAAPIRRRQPTATRSRPLDRGSPSARKAPCDRNRARRDEWLTTDCRVAVACRSSRPDSDKVVSRPPAISFNPFQNSSSRLTLVLWPATTIERLTTGDFIDVAKFMRHPHLLQLSDMGTENSCLTMAVKKQIRSVAKITQNFAVLVLRYRSH